MRGMPWAGHTTNSNMVQRVGKVKRPQPVFFPSGLTSDLWRNIANDDADYYYHNLQLSCLLWWRSKQHQPVISGLCFVALGFFHHQLCGTLDFLRRILSGFIWGGETARDGEGSRWDPPDGYWRDLESFVSQTNPSYFEDAVMGLPDSTFFEDIISWGFISASSLAAGFFQLPWLKQQRFSPNTVSTLRGSYGGPGLDS